MTLLLLLLACGPKPPPTPAPVEAEAPPPRLNYAARSAYLHAHVAWERGELEEAERYLRRALAFDPSDERLRAELAALRAELAGE
ncbi:MAG: tetratricopeptide repeat protein [Alphaproteobacteria bacterium]|nr:tetratricopeptide repeat protein [Alphaproteobacteria bacterium]